MRKKAAVVFALTFASLQAADRLTLAEAKQLALKNHPQIQTAQALEEASDFVPKEIRSRYFPIVSGSVSGVGAPGTTNAIQAGFLTNSTVYSRVAGGVSVNQLISDFGRTHHLAESAELHAKALGQYTNATKADVVLQATRAYYDALRTQAVLKVARDTVAARQLVVNQVTTLANNKLKSELDVSFAQVNLDEAKLLNSDAENDAKSAMAQLDQALGSNAGTTYDLVDDGTVQDLPPDLAPLVPEAVRERPEAQQAQLEIAAAQEFARAEDALKRPTVTALFTAGYSPLHSDKLDDHWVAGGVNIDLPFLNGGLYTARRAEAEAKQRAAAQSARDLNNKISRDVRLAYLSAVNAKEGLQLTSELLEQSNKSFQLAKARYDLGLGTIVELTQAQLNVTRAQIAQAGARFEYQARRATLDYELGVNR
ncbi:MAG TPA: TolC family protein [Bryobacteraceae bacterium]